MSEAFFENVRRAVAVSSRWNSREQLSRSLWPNTPKYIAKADKAGQEISLSRACQIADALGIPVGVLAKRGAFLVKKRPDIQHIMSAIDTSQGDVSAFGDLIEFVDLYHPPSPGDLTIKPYRIGRYSLAAVTLSQFGEDAVKEALESSGNDSLNAELMARYEAALAGLPMLDRVKLDERISIEPYRIMLNTYRLLHRVHDDGKPYILNYSIEVGTLTF